MAKIAWTSNYGTSQIYSSGVELALCSDDNQQIGPFVFCKDFFQDAIVVFLHADQKKTCFIYGYKYDPKTMPPCPTKNLKVLITNAANPKLAAQIPGISDFLHQIEGKLGIQLCAVEQCDDPPDKYKKCGIWLLTADPIWMHAPPLLSGWTLLARNGLMHKVGTKWEDTVKGIIDGKIPAAQTHDRTYMTYGKPGLELILEKGIEALFGKDQLANYPLDKAGHSMHHYSGIVSFGSSMAKPHFPNWQYPEPPKEKPPSVCFQ